MATCGGCGDLSKITMSSADWQRNEQRHECREKRFVAIVVLLVLVLVCNNFGWLVYHFKNECHDTKDVVIEEKCCEFDVSNIKANK
jgi:hypothetical protein